MSLRENLAAVEADTEEAFESRRELVKLLVERIVLSRTDEGRPKVDITYRFGAPTPRVDSADGIRNSDEFKKAHGRGGGGDLLRGHPQMSTYKVTVEREPESPGE